MVATSSIIGCVLFAFACGGLIHWVGQALVPDHFREVVTNPPGDFTRLTGLAWPNTAKLIATGDSHGGFHGDGEFYLVFDLDKEFLEKWLSATPPLGSSKWQSGPVPDEIWSHCGFGQYKPGSSSNEIGRKPNLGGSSWYVAKNRGSNPMPWNNGDLLMIDTRKGRVWLSSWDF